MTTQINDINNINTKNSYDIILFIATYINSIITLITGDLTRGLVVASGTVTNINLLFAKFTTISTVNNGFIYLNPTTNILTVKIAFNGSTTLLIDLTPVNLTNTILFLTNIKTTMVYNSQSQSNLQILYDSLAGVSTILSTLGDLLGLSSTIQSVPVTLDPTTVTTVSDVQTLTNKTLVSPTITSVTNSAGTITFPLANDTMVCRNTTDTLTNKKLVDSSTFIVDVVDNTKMIQLDASGTTNTKTVLVSSQTANITLTLPNSSDTLVGKNTTDVLTNKTLVRPSIASIINGGTLTLPTSTDTLVGRTTVDTLSKKTLIAPSISTIINGGTLTLPTITDTLVGKNTTDVLTNKTLLNPVIIGGTGSYVTSNSVDVLSNKTLVDNSTVIANIADNTKQLGFSISGAATNTKTVFAIHQTVNRTLTFPDATDTIVGRNTTETLTNKTLLNPIIIGGTGSYVTSNSVDVLSNKTLVDNSTTIANFTDNTKTLGFSINGSTNTETTFVTNQTINRTLTFPDATDTIVGRNTSDTLTNKTMTAPIISSIINTGTLSLPITTDTLVGRNTSDTLTNKTITAPIISSIINTGTLTLPITSDTLIGRNTSDTLTNKTMTAPIISAIINTGTITLPTVTDTLVGRDTTDTLTNKTLVSPIITGTSPYLTPSSTAILTNKTLIDSSTVIADVSDNTVQFIFDISGSSGTKTILLTSQTADRTITMPNATDTLVGRNTVDTLTNKTLSSPLVSTIINTGTLTLPTTTDTIVGRDTIDTLTNKTLVSPIITGTVPYLTPSSTAILTNKTLIDSSTVIADVSDNTIQFIFDISGNTGTKTILLTSQTADRTITMPNATDTLVGRDTTDTLTNKTLVSPIITGTLPYITPSSTAILTNKTLIDSSTIIADVSDNTVQFIFDISGNSGTKTTLVTSQTANRTITMPNASDTLVGRDTTDTLTNKTLVSPIITGTLPYITPSSTAILTNKTLIDSSTIIADAADNTTQLIFDVNGSSGTKTVLVSAQTSDRTLTLPDITDTIVTRNTTDILTNKTLIDVSTSIANTSDNSKLVQFSVGGTSGTKTTLSINPTADRTIIIPDADTTLAGTDTTQTLSNKTLISPIITNIINTGTLTIPSSSDTLIGRNTTDVLTNKTLVDSSTLFENSIDTTKKIQFQLSGIASATTRTITVPDANITLVGTTNAQTLSNKILTSPTVQTIINTGTLTLPTTTDTLVGRTTSDSLSNKTLRAGSVFFSDNVDPTKRLGFSLNGAVSTKLLTISAVHTSDIILTLPDATDTLIGAATVNTLSNKTLILPTVSSVYNSGTISIPTGTDTLVGKNTTDVLTNKSLKTNTCYFIENADATKRIGFSSNNAISGKTLVLNSAHTNDRTVTFPDADTILAGIDAVQTLSNKTIISSTITGNNSFADTSDPTKIAQFNMSSISPATTRVISLPDATTTLVGTNATQTLTNKTLTTPIISSISNSGLLTIPTITDTLVGRATADPLSNKLLKSNTCFFVDDTDSTKRIGFAQNTASANTTITFSSAATFDRTIILPDADTTMVGTNVTQTLSNKTMISPNIAIIINTGTLTLPTITDTILARNTTDVLTNKSLSDSSTIIVNASDNTKQLKFTVDGSANTYTLFATNQTANRTITIPNITDTMVTRNTTDTLTNKKLKADTCSIVDSSDVTKSLLFTVSGATSGTQMTITSAHTQNRQITLPNATDTLVGRTTTDTLGNKQIQNNTCLFVDDIDPSKRLKFATYNATTSTQTTIMSSQSSNRIVTLPDDNTTLVGTDTTQSLTNKIIDFGLNTIILSGDQVSNKIWSIEDQKTIGTNGGTFLSGAWRTRTLNAMSYSSGAEVILGINNFTCIPGSYLVKCSAMARRVGVNQLRLFNVSDSSTEAYGLIYEHNDLNTTSTTLDCVFTLVDTKILSIQHRCSISRTLTGFGVATGWGDENYLSLVITKVA